ncbi:MAG: 2,3-bisphosphoglycerate-independent phosphoglycerate mutase, partial [Gammaproteobacteria bacterium]|nr:2,3-bisphosphoglycerate-independent phosphoglycerate mutase [Gammaproteobacteria bacterium]
AYARNESDEFMTPTSIVPPGGQATLIEDGDSVIFMNFRADRARQLCQALVEPGFDGFGRKTWPRLDSFVTLTQYSDDLPASVAFPPESLEQLFGEIISNQGLTQLRLAETEKYAHVTFFFNGGREQPYPGEERILVPSPKVATYDLQPEMNAARVTDHLTDAITNRSYNIIICNYANPDMVGHTGNQIAAVRAIEAVDQCLGRVTEAVAQSGATLLITADHGNAETMLDSATGQPHTAHTTNPVPLILIGDNHGLQSGGKLADVAPTMLALLGIVQPAEMTGHSLLSD